MDEKTLQRLADGLAKEVREFVAERLAPLLVRQVSSDQLIADLEARVAALEAELAKLRGPRRVA